MPNESSCPGCHVVSISTSQPVWLARPVYGLAAPLIILVTLVTNTLVVVVLSHRHLRTPTNHILLSMAVTELMTGLSSCPWFLYYYTFGGYRTDETEGLNEFWCRFHPYFAVHLPTIFHTAAIWLTVFLAIQRYVYVCLPSLAVKHCTPKRTWHIIILIVFLAMVTEIPIMLSERNELETEEDQTRKICYSKYVYKSIPLDTFKAVVLCGRALFVHIVPCLLLILFTGCLFRTINEADRKRSVHAISLKKPAKTSCVSSNRLMAATTRMLLVVIAIFLLIEIPVALIFVFHFLVVYYRVITAADYNIVNTLLIMRNFLIILTYPLNFAIYFGMSSSFKLQFRQMFTRKVLYVASPNTGPGWRPRFSVQLIDIHKIRRPSQFLFPRKSVNESGQPLNNNHLDIPTNLDAFL
ncbi:unnamed protein product, partial [Mesorhabditis belari]|uniref:G-protein coupled receptors family 1 profile domain-containing protein n=1 Tax=Mesorhabditis belari TaxID=2138241 RepID=A0AAF3EGZ7_9BILA